MLKQLLLVGIGGATGSILRYLSSVVTAKYFTHAFPLATFAVNIIGCLLIGLLIGNMEHRQLANPELRLLLITGFCGGYTTFSAFASENLTLLQAGNYITGFAYIAASVLVGLLAVWFGLLLSK